MSTFDVVYFYIVIAVTTWIPTYGIFGADLDAQRIAATCVFWPIVIPLWLLHGLWRLLTERSTGE